jgi:hypothetical protein
VVEFKLAAGSSSSLAVQEAAAGSSSTADCGRLDAEVLSQLGGGPAGELITATASAAPVDAPLHAQLDGTLTTLQAVHKLAQQWLTWHVP